MDWWEFAGLGRLEYGIDPVFHVQVGLDHPPSEDPDVLPMWELDDGIIEGALMTRFPKDGNVTSVVTMELANQMTLAIPHHHEQ